MEVSADGRESRDRVRLVSGSRDQCEWDTSVMRADDGAKGILKTTRMDSKVVCETQVRRKRRAGLREWDWKTRDEAGTSGSDDGRRDRREKNS